MIKGSYLPNVSETRDDLCAASKVMNFNFAFAHMYCADLTADTKAQRGVRAAAFALLDDKHLKLYKRRIENKLLRYYDRSDDASLPQRLPEDDGCCHHFVNDAERVVECVKSVEAASAGVNVVVLLPYLKQLQIVLKMLFDAFACCSKTINGLQMYVHDLLSHCLLCADKIEAANRALQVINLFLDSPLYECDLCKEASADKRFLTRKDCCAYALCNACCVALWKASVTHAKCPACSTSFK
ncbi:ie-0 [Antheraea pernyi nucleopolyhedrovirus]|uniref:Ie-0 n=2 Tax=Antheraea pernyi nuclear polyhedrosis virus TaxID=161494 RepID=Q1HH80_NPVAP|nr:ie-0 [Antheraea pernyi nucleopolyhedrovirus]AWD33682.1 immediate early protein 0 [Antheraea proylei nucleopolyhedrovirus]BBD50471.1 immediate early protein 0 [Antheraea yamamai nucleopolyhedrovirus]BBD50623.1 immediate early protein 0 [Samia cynthia nucleopolyhedrovirus]ABF50258.1 ie-0 [Antheraea pernyi nucleopolyhedrovirus]ABQ12245.1 immediate early protein 0 [Antheraea pernyi nucleopolyhedrovirus]